MKDLTLYILKHLVDHPDEIEVIEEELDNGAVTLTIKVHQDDMGRVIGKDGKIIRSLRDVIKILALKLNKHADIILAE
jgi:uncharacterized protein